MAEIGEEREQPKPSLWETLASTQGAQPQNNNGWNQSDQWSQSPNDDAKWKSDGWGTSSGQKEPYPPSWTRSRTRSSHHNRSRNVRRSSRSPRGDLRQLVNRGANWREESLSPPHCGGNATRSQGISLVCNNRTIVENENQPGLSSPRIKLPGQNDENRHNGRRPHSPVMTQSRLRYSSPFSHAAQEVHKSSIAKESDGWGMRSSHAERSRSRSLSPWSLAAQNTKGDSDSKDTEKWGKDLDQTGGLNAWNQTNSNDLLPNHDSDRWRGGHSAFRSRDRRFSTENKRKRTGRDTSRSPEHKWRKTGQHPDRSRCSERSVSPENRPRRTGWGRGRSRGRGDTSSSRLSRWGPASSNVDDSRSKSLSQWSQVAQKSTKNANQEESDRWGQDSSPVKKSRSRSVSPWSQAAVDINKNYNNKETDRWGTTIDQIGPDAWNQPRSNLSPDRGFKRWGPASPNVDDSRSKSLSQWSQVAQKSMKNANQEESDGWGQDSSSVKKSRSRSVSPWSQAAVDINKNYNNKETDCWGTTLDQTGPDAWNQPRSNLSPDRGFKRRGQEPCNQSRLPAPKWRRTGWDLDRPRGRDSSYSPDNKQRTGWSRGGSRYRGRGRTNSPYKCQKRREKRDPSYSPISRSRRSPSLQRSPSRVPRMDQNREKRDGSEGRYDKKTNYGDTAAKVTSWEGLKLHDWSVNALRSSLKDPNLIFNWGGLTNRHGNESSATHTTTLHQEVVQSSTEWAVPKVAGNTNAGHGNESSATHTTTLHQEVVQSSTEWAVPKVAGNTSAGHGNESSATHTTTLHQEVVQSSTEWAVPKAAGNTNAGHGNESSATHTTTLHEEVVQSSTEWAVPKAAGNTNAGHGNESSATHTTTLHQEVVQSSTEWAVPKAAGNTNAGHGNESSATHTTTLHQEVVQSSTEWAVPKAAGNTNAGHGNESSATHTTTLHQEVVQSSTEWAVPKAAGNTNAGHGNTRVAGNTMAIPDASCKTKQRGIVMEETISQDLQISSQYHGDVKEKVVKKSPGIEHSMNGTTYHPLSYGPWDPTPEGSKLGQSQLNQNLVRANGTTAGEKTDEVDNHSFKWALIGFAKPKLKPFWLKQHLNDAEYRQILSKFVSNVTRSLGTCAPHTHENSCKFVKEQDDSLSKCLQMYLGRFVSEDIIQNMRYDGRSEKSKVFP